MQMALESVDHQSVQIEEDAEQHPGDGARQAVQDGDGLSTARRRCPMWARVPEDDRQEGGGRSSPVEVRRPRESWHCNAVPASSPSWGCVSWGWRTWWPRAWATSTASRRRFFPVTQEVVRLSPGDFPAGVAAPVADVASVPLRPTLIGFTAARLGLGAAAGRAAGPRRWTTSPRPRAPPRASSRRRTRWTRVPSSSPVTRSCGRRWRWAPRTAAWTWPPCRWIGWRPGRRPCATRRRARCCWWAAAGGRRRWRRWAWTAWRRCGASGWASTRRAPPITSRCGCSRARGCAWRT